MIQNNMDLIDTSKFVFGELVDYHRIHACLQVFPGTIISYYKIICEFKKKKKDIIIYSIA